MVSGAGCCRIRGLLSGSARSGRLGERFGSGADDGRLALTGWFSAGLGGVGARPRCWWQGWVVSAW